MFLALQEVCRWTRNYYSAMPAETSDQLILHSAVKAEMWGPERAHQSTPRQFSCRFSAAQRLAPVDACSHHQRYSKH